MFELLEAVLALVLFGFFLFVVAIVGILVMSSIMDFGGGTILSIVGFSVFVVFLVLAIDGFRGNGRD